MSNRNRDAGHALERKIVNELKELGINCVSSRSESRNMDNSGIDIFGDMPFYIQCKKTCNNPSYHELITECGKKDRPLVIFHDKVQKQKTRFFSKGEYVIMTKEYFYELFKNTLKND